MLRQYTKGVKLRLSAHFSSTEFDCPCDECKVTLIHDDLITKLELVRVDMDTALTVTSGYRCKSYQQILRLRGYETAKGTSQHELGKAADLTNNIAPGAELEGYARAAGFKAVGVGKRFIHVDLRDDELRWFYK